jgi:uncharacterized repeat protein (TIGR03803 family)
MSSDAFPTLPCPQPHLEPHEVIPHTFFRGCAFALAFTLLLCYSALAQTYSETVIHSFAGGASGTEPLFSGVIRDRAGNFYGTTYSGGAFNLGTVFKVDNNGNATVLHSFTGGSDGATPYAGLVRDAAGHMYGTTYNGGLKLAACALGCGVVFEIDLGGHEKVLHQFSSGTDGAFPVGGLILDTAGDLYGATESGGTYNFGMVFKIDSKGIETVVHYFAGAPEGQFPFGRLVRDSAGNFYGTTSGGGAGFGTVYKMTAAGQLTVLHSFAGGSDGATPEAGVLLEKNGDLYGTTYLGGANNVGTVYKVDATGNETVLHTFDGSDGSYPESALVHDPAGNLFGTTVQGGTGGFLGGTVFKITPDGMLTSIYDFTGGVDGGGPAGSLMIDRNGNLYGTTAAGGSSGHGTVFKLTPQ